MKFTQAIVSVFSVVVVLTLASCGSGSKQNADEFAEAKDSLKKHIEDVVYNIPSPTEIPYIIQGTGAEFNPGLTNPLTRLNSYTTRNDKAAINLGIYVADIGYFSSYDKTQEAIEYLGACKTLADNLNVIGSFDMQLLQRFEANISNKDSLARILDATVHKTENFLVDDDRNRLAAQVIAGSFIEGLHISTGLVKSFPKDLLPDEQRNMVLTNIIRVVLEQKKSVSELIKMLESIEQTEPIASILPDLKRLESTYASLNIEEQIKNNHGDLVLSDANLVEITNIVEKIRAKITE
jgi:hypothetical protein